MEPTMMDALRVTGAGALSLCRVPRPEPGPGEVAVDVAFVGICGTDLEIARGDMVYYTTGAARYPNTLGHEWSGIVSAVGEGVSAFAAGDAVVGECSIGCELPSCARCAGGAYHRCAARTETGIMNRDGGAAERIVLPARVLFRVGPALSLRAAALIEPAAVALNAVSLGGVRAGGGLVVVLGDGPIGLLLLMTAIAKGADAVLVVGADPARLALAARLGAEAVIDARATHDVPGALRGLAAGRDIGVVLEATGVPDAVHTAVAAAAPGAVIILQGLCGAHAGAPRSLDVDRVVVEDMTLRGALGSPHRWPEAIALAEAGRLNLEALVSHELPLREFEAAFALVRERKAVKVLLVPGSVKAERSRGFKT
jgi:hypothetical protein